MSTYVVLSVSVLPRRVGPRYSLHVPLSTSTSSPSSPDPLGASPRSCHASSLAPPPTTVVCPPLASAMWHPPRHPCLVELRVACSLRWSTRGRAYLMSCAPSGRSRSPMRVAWYGGSWRARPSHLFRAHCISIKLSTLFASFICFSTIFWDLWHEKCDMILIETASSWAPSVQPKSNDCHRPHQYKIMLSV